jgi:hypothetical protein
MSSEPKTVRVRILVLVSPDGRWNSGGYTEAKTIDDLSWVCDGMPDDVELSECRQVWVEADVPIPEPEAIEGRVSDV